MIDMKILEEESVELSHNRDIDECTMCGNKNLDFDYVVSHVEDILGEGRLRTLVIYCFHCDGCGHDMAVITERISDIFYSKEENPDELYNESEIYRIDCVCGENVQFTSDEGLEKWREHIRNHDKDEYQLLSEIEYVEEVTWRDR